MSYQGKACSSQMHITVDTNIFEGDGFDCRIRFQQVWLCTSAERSKAKYGIVSI